MEIKPTYTEAIVALQDLEMRLEARGHRQDQIDAYVIRHVITNLEEQRHTWFVNRLQEIRASWLRKVKLIIARLIN